MRAVVFVNGEVGEIETLRGWLRPDDYLIAADGGAHHLAALGLAPAVIVGDLDSIEPALLDRYRADGVTIERHPVAKDATDLELAIGRAVEDGASQVLLVAALGGRLDQTFANLLILGRRQWPVPLAIAEGDQLARVLRGPETVCLSGPVGSLVSAVALSEKVTGISYTGLEYPLHDATLELGSTRGISNLLAASPAQISIQSGLLLVIQQVEQQPSAV